MKDETEMITCNERKPKRAMILVMLSAKTFNVSMFFFKMVTVAKPGGSMAGGRPFLLKKFKTLFFKINGSTQLWVTSLDSQIDATFQL